jgi:hypothetical protein
MLHAVFLLGLFFNPEDEFDMFLQNVHLLSACCAISYLIMQVSSSVSFKLLGMVYPFPKAEYNFSQIYIPFV